MLSRDVLYLHEQMMLLLLKDAEGTVEFGVSYQYPLAGAMIAELILHNRVRIVESKKKKMVELIDSTLFDEPVLDECLEKVKNAPKRASVQSWVHRFSRLKKLKIRIAQQLCKKGILFEEEGKVLFFF